MGATAWFFGVLRGGLEIAIVVGLAMLAIVVAANTIGVVLPFLLSRLGIDPAVASSPLITSIADVAGLVIYFWLASTLLGSMA